VEIPQRALPDEVMGPVDLLRAEDEDGVLGQVLADEVFVVF
jgi:hypothetical protein